MQMTMDLKQLVNPDSLTESVLLEILKSRCIEVPNIKALKKSELIEIFKRVALPMPQRHYNEEKHLGKKLNELRLARKISVATEDEQALYESAISSLNSSANKSGCRQPKPSSEDNPLPKKIRLANSTTGTNSFMGNGLKRKNNTEDATQKEVKKHQKITWP